MLEGRLARLDAEDERVRQGFRAGIFDVGQAGVELARSEHARELLASELAELRERAASEAVQRQRAATLQAALRTLRRRLPQLTPKERQAVVQELVTGITMRGEAVEIELVLGVPRTRNRPGGPTSQPSSFGEAVPAVTP